MRYDDFIHRVQERVEVGSDEDAIKIIRATLETLGECLLADRKAPSGIPTPNRIKEDLQTRDMMELLRKFPKELLQFTF